MIKKYNQFIKENKYVDLETQHGSMGEYIESMNKDLDDEQKASFSRIVGKYLDVEENPMDVRMASAINTLKSFDQRMLAKELQDEFSIKESVTTDDQKDVANDFENDLKEYSVAGSGALRSFLKVISALGINDIQKSKDCPNTFFSIYIHRALNNMTLKDALMRFKSLSWGQKVINDYLYQDIDIYYGIKWSGKAFNFEYGLIINKEERHPVGEFKLTNSIINKFRGIKSKSIQTLNTDLGRYDVKIMKMMMRMKMELLDYEPGKYVEKSAVTINKELITISYNGLGSWTAGEFSGDIEDIKDDFKGWVLQRKWSKYVLVSVKPKDMNIHFTIKVK